MQETPQKSTPFYPRNPYGVAKLYAYWITVNYRESYGMYACNGLFNHESLAGVKRLDPQITRGLARVDTSSMTASTWVISIPCATGATPAIT